MQDWRDGQVRYLIHFDDGGSGMRMRDEPLDVGCELDDGGVRYRVVRVEPPPNPRSFGHAWAARPGAHSRTSLIRLEVTDHGARSRMLETIRQFVAERLAARADVAAIERRHAEHYRLLAEQADRPLRSFGQNVWVERLEAEASNLNAAVRWYLAHDAAPLPHLFGVLSPFRVLWVFWGLRYEIMGEARSWVDQLLPTRRFARPTGPGGTAVDGRDNCPGVERRRGRAGDPRASGAAARRDR